MLVGVLVVLLVAAGAVVTVLVLRSGDGPEDVARRYLDATWRADAATQCELAEEPWRRYLYGAVPYRDCAAYADAAEAARGTAASEGDAVARLVPFLADTDVRVDVVTRSEAGGRARVAYVVAFTYHGADRAGFDAVWQGRGAYDKGSVELVRSEGRWRVAAVASD